MSAATLFALDAPVVKAAPRKVPAPARPRVHAELPGTGVHYEITERPDGSRVARQVTLGARAPWDGTAPVSFPLGAPFALPSRTELEPGAAVNRQALAVSGLDPHSHAFRAQARPLVAVLEELARRIEGCELAGHNVAFDRRMLAAHYEACGLETPAALREGAAVTDTQTIARDAKKRRSLDTKSVSLGNVAAALGIQAGAAHRAAGDVGTALRVFRALKKLESARAA